MKKKIFIVLLLLIIGIAGLFGFKYFKGKIQQDKTINSFVESAKANGETYLVLEINPKLMLILDENNKVKIRRGDIIKARVSTIITSGMNGIPASIIFDDFKIDGITPGQVTDTLEVFGQDRTYFVFPLKWALTFLPPTGSLTNFIKGGHVRVRTNKIFTLYYHPKWL